MSQHLNPTGHITGPGPNTMQHGDCGLWNVARVRPSPVPCEQTIYHEGGMLNDIHKISCQIPCSYTAPCDAIYLHQQYPWEGEILRQASDCLHCQDNLFMPDIVFSNAIFESKVLKDVRNVPKNSLFSPNFFLTLITYGFYLIQFAFIVLTFTLLYLFFSIFVIFRTSRRGIQTYFVLSLMKNTSRTTILQVLVILILWTWFCTLFPQIRSLCPVWGFNSIKTSQLVD